MGEMYYELVHRLLCTTCFHGFVFPHITFNLSYVTFNLSLHSVHIVAPCINQLSGNHFLTYPVLIQFPLQHCSEYFPRKKKSCCRFHRTPHQCSPYISLDSSLLPRTNQYWGSPHDPGLEQFANPSSPPPPDHQHYWDDSTGHDSLDHSCSSLP